MLMSGVNNTLGASTDAGAAQAKLNQDLNQFLNLLVTQLQNQDPLDPMDATEFTSQLVQFASVEQQIYANAHLEELVSLQSAGQTSSMVNYLGTTIEAFGNMANLDDGHAETSYTLTANANTVTISVKDETGDIVYSTSGETGSGMHDFTWDGIDKNGIQQPDGSYTVVVSALDAQGKVMAVSQTVTGRVTGASTVDGSPYLFMGDIGVAFDNIITVRETPAAVATD